MDATKDAFAELQKAGYVPATAEDVAAARKAAVLRETLALGDRSLEQLTAEEEEVETLLANIGPAPDPSDRAALAAYAGKLSVLVGQRESFGPRRKEILDAQARAAEVLDKTPSLAPARGFTFVETVKGWLKKAVPGVLLGVLLGAVAGCGSAIKVCYTHPTYGAVCVEVDGKHYVDPSAPVAVQEAAKAAVKEGGK